ncbi:MAG: PIN domain-containing protein [Candidatus Aminicenantales bacterium]|jgi:predicted nucleic acid-binding protein
MKENRIFLDTDILVYAYDSSAGRKHEIAKDLAIGLWRSGGGLLSTQVLQEFFVTVTKKIKAPMNAGLAREIVEDMLTWDVIVNDGDSILQAIDLRTREKLSFWDALIIAAAIRAEAQILLSEDLPHGRSIGNVTIRDPFL